MRSKIHQVTRTVTRRRHDKLLITMAQVASELLEVTSQDGSIPRTLGAISDVIGSNRAFVFTANLASSGNTSNQFCSWDSPNKLKLGKAGPISVATYDPPEFVGLYNGNAVSATRASASAILQDFLKEVELISVLLVPIIIEGTYWGFIGFDTSHSVDPWTVHEISVLYKVASLIGASITRERYIKQLVTERADAQKKYVEAETANVSKSNFLTSMSHELRTPLNAILGFSSILMAETFGSMGSPKYKEYASDIHNSGEHLLSLVNDLLDMAKIEAGRMELEPRLLETQSAIDHALRVVGAKASERKQMLTTEVETESATIYADERAFTQIVINLVSNAVKFAPHGGHISVSARRDSNGDYELAVQDDGLGIPKEKLDRLFQPFSQTDNRYHNQEGGTGLGLALVRGLARLHGGGAWLQSEEGKGTRAVVILQSQNKYLQPQTTSKSRIAV